MTCTLIWKSSKHLTFKLSTWSERCLTALLTIHQHVVLSHGPRTLCPAYGTEEKDPAEHVHLLGYHNTSFKCIKVEGGEKKTKPAFFHLPESPLWGFPAPSRMGTRRGKAPFPHTWLTTSMFVLNKRNETFVWLPVNGFLKRQNAIPGEIC